jgi:hypothetical protein
VDNATADQDENLVHEIEVGAIVFNLQRSKHEHIKGHKSQVLEILPQERTSGINS